MSGERAITTPAGITDGVLAYAGRLSTSAPQFVEVVPDESAILDQCFFNVILSGDKPVYGWLIWELTGFWLEAVRHAVVERDGKLVDITPPVDGEARLLFVPDPDWEFDYLDPKPTRRPARHLLTDDADVVKWAGLADEFDALKWRNSRFRGERIEMVLAPGKDTRRMERLQRDYNAAAKVALGKPLA